jgi:hypothetical protein
MAWRIQSTVVSTKESDWNYGLYTTALQSHLELWLGIIAANLPTLAPLFARFIKPVVKSYFRSRSFKQPSTGGKHLPRTFGSGDPTIKRDKFNRLADNSVDFPVELIERQDLNKVEAGGASRTVSSYAIAMRRDVDVRVEVFDPLQRNAHVSTR